MSVSYRAMIFTVLNQQDLTSIQKSVATALIIRGDDKKHTGPWREVMNWKQIAALTGLPPNLCQNAFETLCAKGWFEIQVRAHDGKQRYVIPYVRLAQAAEQRDEKLAKSRERIERTTAA